MIEKTEKGMPITDKARYCPNAIRLQKEMSETASRLHSLNARETAKILNNPFRSKNYG